MKTVKLVYEKLEDPRFYLEYNIMEKFFADHNLTEKEVLEKPMLDILAAPFNMGTYQHCTTGPAVVLRAKEAYTTEEGVKIEKDQARHEEYWFEGKRRTGKEEDEFRHSIQFGTKFQDLVNED